MSHLVTLCVTPAVDVVTPVSQIGHLNDLPFEQQTPYLSAMQDGQNGIVGKKRKKVDHEALQSPLNRIPGMNTDSVRDLLDLGFCDVDELRGRSPEALFEDIKAVKPSTPADRLAYLRMGVYYAEAENPDPQLMEPWKWNDSSMAD